MSRVTDVGNVDQSLTYHYDTARSINMSSVLLAFDAGPNKVLRVGGDLLLDLVPVEVDVPRAVESGGLGDVAGAVGGEGAVADALHTVL